MIKENEYGGKPYKCGNKKDAQKQNLVQIIVWVPNSVKEMRFIIKEYDRLALDKTRVCLIVTHQNRLALFANNLIGKDDESAESPN